MPASIDFWEVVATPPGMFGDGPPERAQLEWRAAEAPFRGSDSEDHWFRSQFVADGAAPLIRFGGLATACDVYVDRLHALRSDSMFIAHELPVEPGPHELHICARALDPILAVSRRPRARWRTRVPSQNSLRWARTSLLGRAPGFAPGPPFVGPWRPVEVLGEGELAASIRTRVDGDAGVLAVTCDGSAGPLEVVVDGRSVSLPSGGGEVRISGAERWWPHTHGSPHLYNVEVRGDGRASIHRVGFRQLKVPAATTVDGLSLTINGVRIFTRGAIWTPTSDDEIRDTLLRLREAGLNLVRVVGTMVYESKHFHDLCDELGLFVWQDLMFANMDYPIADPAFRELVDAEVRQALAEVGGRPSLAVVCGNSEVEQQVAMLGLDQELGRGELFGSLIPLLVAEAGLDAAYLPSAPTGGRPPFRTDAGVVNYFGVGAYLRSFDDVRRAAVPFASECLAFANVPDTEPPDHTDGVMRDVGADWDFADVRDHYLALLHGITRGHVDYWARSRIVTGETMSEVLGEWRRESSVCSGAIILWARDLRPGAGWGILDSDGSPKAVWGYLRRVLAPVAVWTTDEGLNGVGIHVANDTAAPLQGDLRVTLFRDFENAVHQGFERVEVGAHSSLERSVEGLLGYFVDAAYAYRFGPPQHDLIVTSLEIGGELVSQDFRFPVGRPHGRVDAEELGFEGRASRDEFGRITLHVRSRRLAYGVRSSAVGYLPSDDAFSIEPGGRATVRLRPGVGAVASTVRLEALNLATPLDVPVS